MHYAMLARWNHCEDLHLDAASSPWDAGAAINVLALPHMSTFPLFALHAGINGDLLCHYVFGVSPCSFALGNGMQVRFPPVLVWKCSPKHFETPCHVRTMQRHEETACIWDHPLGTSQWMQLKSFSAEHGPTFFACATGHGAMALSPAATQLVHASLLATPPEPRLLVGE